MKLDGEDLLRCPRRPILDNPEFYSRLFGRYRHYQKGHFFEEGAIGSQPALLMECFDVMDQTLDVVENYRREQEAKKRARKRKG